MIFNIHEVSSGPTYLEFGSQYEEACFLKYVEGRASDEVNWINS